MADEERTEVSENTKEEEERDEGQTAGADRAPTSEEENLAEAGAEELEKDGELESIGEHHREMDQLGAEVKGEGSIS